MNKKSHIFRIVYYRTNFYLCLLFFNALIVASICVVSHSLRHTRATQLLALGVPLEEIQLLLGHSTKEVTERYYLHLDEMQKSHLQKVLTAMHNDINSK